MTSLEILSDDLQGEVLAHCTCKTLAALAASGKAIRARAYRKLLQFANDSQVARSWRTKNAAVLRKLMWKSGSPLAMHPVLMAAWADCNVSAQLASLLMQCSVAETQRMNVLAALQGQGRPLGTSLDSDSGSDDDDEDRVVDGVRTVILRRQLPEAVNANARFRRGRKITASCGASRCDGTCRTYVGDDTRETRIVLLLRAAGATRPRQYAIEKRTQRVSRKHMPGARFTRCVLGSEHWHGQDCPRWQPSPPSLNVDMRCCCHLDERGRPGGLSQRMLEIPGMASSIKSWRAWDEPWG